MKKTGSAFFLLIITFICTPNASVAEASLANVLSEYDLSQIQQYADSTAEGYSVFDTVLAIAGGNSGDILSEFFQTIPSYLLRAFKNAMSVSVWVISSALISAGITQFVGNSKGAQLACYVCRLSCGVTLTGIYFQRAKSAAVFIENIAGFSDAVIPVLTAMLSATGSSSAAAAMAPVTAFTSGLLSQAAAVWGIRFCSVAAGLAVAGNLNANLPMKKMFSLVRSLLSYFAGGVLTLYMLLISAKGLVSGTADSIGFRAARYAVDNAMPVIGSNIAGAMDELHGSIVLIKSAVGITGILILAAMCAQPILELASVYISIRFAAAITEPVADEKLVLMTEQFSKVMEMLLVVCVVSAVLLIILLGATARAGSRLIA